MDTPAGRYTWHTRNTKVAAALQVMRFPCKAEVQEDARSGEVFTRFWHAAVSLTGVGLGQLIGDWRSGALAVAEPMHPFLQALRCLHNYDLLLDAEKQGRRLRLVAVADGVACEYRDGEELPEMQRAAVVWRTQDRALAAAVGTLGLPVIKIEGGPWFTLPVHGHFLKGVHGRGMVRFNGVDLAVRAGRDLALEARDPLHPLVPAYHAREYYRELLKAAGEAQRKILLRPPGAGGRMAEISAEATGRVMEKVRRHLNG